MTRRCVFCGGAATQRHHVTARLTGDGPYLDPSFTVDVCRACHLWDHRLQRAAGLDDLVEPIRARVARMAWLYNRLHQLGRGLAAAPTLLAASGSVLHDALDALGGAE